MWEHRSAVKAFPAPCWFNTSSNSIVRDLTEKLDDDDGVLQEELEVLMNQGTIEKPVHEDITYDSIYDTEDNLWNFLFFTGYLKKISVRMDGENQYVTMAIPNSEVSYIYRNTIRTWFDKKALMQRSRKYRVRSNRETGLGRVDLILRTQRIRTGRAIIPASNEPCSRTCADIWRMPRGGAVCQWHTFSTDRSGAETKNPVSLLRGF